MILNTMHDGFFHTVSLLRYYHVKSFLFSCVDIWYWFLSQRRDDRDSFHTKLQKKFTSSAIPKEQLVIFPPFYIFKYSRTLEGYFGVSIIYMTKKKLFRSRTATLCIKNLQSPFYSNSTFWMGFKMKWLWGQSKLAAYLTAHIVWELNFQTYISTLVFVPDILIIF